MISSDFDDLTRQITLCRACPRLVAWREQVGAVKRKAYRSETYWAKPVPGFGDAHAQVMVVGLAPGAHGSNRTGRMFTGDASGNFLYPSLYNAGFASQPKASNMDDGLNLTGMFITAVCRCVPPDNKPASDEIARCLPYLRAEMRMLKNLEGVVALGKIAFDQILRELYPLNSERAAVQFKHGVFVEGGGTRPWILGSYHPSRQNTQTGRLTAPMFDAIWQRVNRLLE
ncbi:MAG: uracil-DNA glycosylase [Anaerolineaceae bacterium]|jgi:uracil-DNA glycosylase family 4